MRNSIIEKLSEELNLKIKRESQVLYILAEIRKHLEEYIPKDGNKYESLYFVCDWVLHITMNRNRTRHLLEELDRYFEKTYKDRTSDADYQFLREQSGLFFLMEFKDGLRSFLKNNGLSTKVVDEGKVWKTFRKLLLGILTDCPLRNDRGFVRKFSFVRNVSADPETITFRIDYGNGRNRTYIVDDKLDRLTESNNG